MSMKTKLASLRKQHGLTQAELAEKLNVSRQAISRWEVGVATPSTDNLKSLSALYGISVDDFLKEEAVDSVQNAEPQNLHMNNTAASVKNRKSMLVLSCVWVALLLIAVIMVSVVKFNHRQETTDLPMENMAAEEDDGEAGMFSFE